MSPRAFAQQPEGAKKVGQYRGAVLCCAVLCRAGLGCAGVLPGAARCSRHTPAPATLAMTIPGNVLCCLLRATVKQNRRGLTLAACLQGETTGEIGIEGTAIEEPEEVRCCISSCMLLYCWLHALSEGREVGCDH